MPKRKIRIELTGPEVALWIDDHVSHIGTRGAIDPAVAGPLVGHSAYEKSAVWHIPYDTADDEEIPSWRLLAQAIRTFLEVVPGARDLLDKHRSGVKVEIIGGPR